MRTFQEHQNAMLKSLRDHNQSLLTQNFELKASLHVLTEMLTTILRATQKPEITDIEVLRTLIKNELIQYLDKQASQG